MLNGKTLVSLGLCAVGCASLATAQEVRYTVTELGAMTVPSPSGIGNGGHIAGNFYNAAGQRRAFLWNGTSTADLGTLGGIAQAQGLNAAGVAVGYSVDAQNRQRAVRFAGGSVIDLGTLNGGTAAAAHGINSQGWIAGVSDKRFGSDLWQRAALWRNGQVLDLGTFGGEFSEARSVSDAGHVVGWAWTPLPSRSQRAFVWTESGGMVDLGVLGNAWHQSAAVDVNSHGVVVGSALTSTGFRAFKWATQTGMVDLGVYPGTLESVCGGVNIHGQVVGYSYKFNDDCTVTSVPVMWENGTMTSLQDAIAGSGWVLQSASDINDQGDITGIANGRAVLLRPIIGGGCGTSDFNGDGDFGTDQDIEAYFACLGGSCCSTCFAGGADFNGDGDVGTDQDIEAFFRVLAGGNC